MRKPVLFYGVNNEGMGHATRARVVIEQLSKHYEVYIFCGGRAREVLKGFFPRVYPVWYGRLVYQNNRADVRATTIRSFIEGPWVLATGAMVTIMAWLLRPVAIISDFECMTAWAGMLSFTKVVTLDNQMLMLHGDLPPLPAEDEAPARVVRRVMFFNTPVVHKALICSFYQPPLLPSSDPSRVRYVPVAVRPLVRELRSRVRTDGPVLVYQTSTTNADLPGTLEAAAWNLCVRRGTEPPPETAGEQGRLG
jgi:uncharacterized protein (TIGR00661 family)